MNRSMRAPLLGLAPLVLVLLLWQLLGPEQSVYAPRPSAWVERLGALAGSGQLGEGFLDTLVTFSIGLVVSAVLGSLLGLLVGRVPLADRALGPLFEFFRVLPPAAIVPVAVLLAGYSENMKVGVVVLSAIWPVLLQVRTSAKTLDPILFEVGRVMRLSRAATFRKILLPSLAPSVFQGVRLATPTVLVIVLLVELVTRINGLGGLINASQGTFDSAAVYGLLAVTGLMALAVSILLGTLDRLIVRHRG